MKFVELAVIILSISVIITSFLSVVIVEHFPSSQLPTAKASESHIYLCVNNPPNITNVSCPPSFNQTTRVVDNRISCRFNFSDEDGNPYSVESIDLSENGLWVTLLSNGTLHINASQDGVGSHVLEINVTDESGCPNSETLHNYTFTVFDINDPPEYILDLPASEVTQGRSISPYSLYDYFDDPDGDSLNFSVLGANAVSVDITQSSGAVVYTGVSCSTDYLIFTATDPGNLSDDSGLVTVKVNCPQSTNDDSSGGGSGGGSSAAYSCTSKWDCKDWSTCDINGTQFKICIDLNGCEKSYTKHFYRNCTYIPTCSDGVQNGDETGVDCGGSCPLCGTCYDGIQNNDEEGVDCGGLYCEACHNCSDGIFNWEEEGLDCGGPFCTPCPSCMDGMKNCHYIQLDNGTWEEQCETGVDCGGPCSPCTINEIPGVIAERKSLLGTILLTTLSLFVVFGIAYKFFYKQFKQVLARLGWYLTRKRRKEILLKSQDKQELLSSLAKWEKKFPKRSKDLLILLDELSSIIRSYYSKAFNLLFEFSPEDLSKSLDQLGHESLKLILMNFFTETSAYEQGKKHLSRLQQKVLAQELRELIFSTSVTDKDDLGHVVDELKLSGSLFEQFHITAYNLFLAVEFESVNAAKEHYYSLVGIYSKLSEKDKVLAYPTLQRAYQIIKYLLSWV